MRPALTGCARMRRAAMTRLLLTAALSSVSFLCHAEGALLKVPTREGVTTTLFWEPAPNAKATVFLFPGGGGGFGGMGGGGGTPPSLPGLGGGGMPPGLQDLMKNK